MMKILSKAVRFTDDMPEPDDALWIDGFDWAAVIASGHSEERAVEVLAEAQEERDRASGATSYDAERVSVVGAAHILTMQDARGWEYERAFEMLKTYERAYQREWRSREELDAFLRRVGQKK